MRTIDRYHKWIEWSEEDQVYIGRCPDLISGIHGDDPQTVFRDLYEVVESVIADYESQLQFQHPSDTVSLPRYASLHSGAPVGTLA